MKENERMKDVSNLEKHQEESWNRLKRDISSSAHTIHEIDAGRARGYSRALFVSSILNKVSTYAGKGEVEIVEKAVDLVREYNARSSKPVITARNRFFQLPEVARQNRLKLKEIREKEKRKWRLKGNAGLELRSRPAADPLRQHSQRRDAQGTEGFRIQVVSPGSRPGSAS